jgi:predicted secreted protein
MQLQVVAHCLLNPHTRVKGLGPLDFKPEPPLIQLPCPEALYLGLDRWAVTRNQLEVPEFRRFCKSLVVQYADIIGLLASKGTSIRIVGVAGSPSCGVLTTSVGYQGGSARESPHRHVTGMGVFMEELTGELESRGVAFDCQESGEDQKIDRKIS